MCVEGDEVKRKVPLKENWVSLFPPEEATFWVSFFGSWTVEEIAEALKISKSNAPADVLSALKRLFQREIFVGELVQKREPETGMER